MSLHNTDFEVHDCYTPHHMEEVIDQNKDRLGFYLWEVYGLGDRALLVLGFPKKLKGQSMENSSSYLYAVERVRNADDLQAAISEHGLKIGFYIFKSCYIPEYNEWWFIMAWTNPKILADLKAEQEKQKVDGANLELEREERDRLAREANPT